MGRKTSVPNPHLIKCFHMKQGGHQDFGSYPFQSWPPRGPAPGR